MALPRPGRAGAPLGTTSLEVAQELVTIGQQLGVSRTVDPKPKINMEARAGLKTSLDR